MMLSLPSSDALSRSGRQVRSVSHHFLQLCQFGSIVTLQLNSGGIFDLDLLAQIVLVLGKYTDMLR